ncbi:MAG: hypothetical protein R3B45_01550 [Bdellovibrionota bacterium]
MSKIWLRLFMMTFALGCGEGKNTDSEGENSTDQTDVDSSEDPTKSSETGAISIPDDAYPQNLQLTNLTVPETLPAVQQNVPQALTLSIAASLTEYAIDCSDSYSLCIPGDIQEQKSCTFIADVKCRFFGDSGPTQFKQLLGNIDANMNQIEEHTKDYNVPCLDETNTAGYEFDTDNGQVVIAPYKLSTFSLSFPDLKDINNASQPLDLDKTYKLSCIDKYTNDDSSSGWNAIGIEKSSNESTYYLANGNSQGIGGVATIDSNDNVDYFGAVGESGINSYEDITQSNALIHLKSRKDVGILELTFTGVNVGPGCGMRMMTDGTNLYAQANMNNDRECLTSDSGYDASVASMEFCLDVSGESPSTQALSVCSGAGLDADAFTVEALKREQFEATNIKYLFVDVPEDLSPFTKLELK